MILILILILNMNMNMNMNKQQTLSNSQTANSKQPHAEFNMMCFPFCTGTDMQTDLAQANNNTISISTPNCSYCSYSNC